MTIEETHLKDCYIISPKIFEDKRGYFLESYNKSHFYKETGFNIDFIQDNESKSRQGVLRGLHYQTPPYSQAKLLRVIQGKILDVAVDLRKDSPTFGQYESVILSEENKKQFFVPRGFAHGFFVLSEIAIITYKIDNIYSPNHDTGIIWNDKDLNIDWQIGDRDIILSEKDKILQSFKDFESPF